MTDRPIRILLIEDNPGDARLIELLLSEARMPVVLETAGTLSSGIDRLSESDLDAVLLDLTLPDSEGLETFRRLNEAAPGVPIVVLSGLADEDLAARAVHFGAQDYLVKGQVDGRAIGRAVRYAVERKQVEAELRRKEELLREAQQIARLGSWEWEIDSGRIMWSDVLCGIYGLEPGGAVVTIEGYLERVHPDDRARVRDALRGALHDHRPFEFDERIVRPDGTVRIVHTRGQVQFDEGRRSFRLVGACQDITERREQELEVERARDAALRSAKLKSAFVANMSHEIRTPLNVILGYAGLMVDAVDPPDPGQRRELSRAIHRASERLMTTIDGILDISKMETGNFDVRPEPLPLRTLLERHVQDFASLAKEKGLEISFENEEPAAVIRFDEYCLSHALMNLLQNAIKFTATGGIAVRLFRGGNGRLTIEVRDTGIGIDRDYLPRIFDAFSQEDVGYTRRFEGSGLGLALTREYLTRNGASISVDSRKGAGSVFRVELSPECEVLEPPPRSVEDPVRDPDPDCARPAAERKPVVLVVEDDLDTQAYMRELLHRRFEVRIAATAEEARAHLDACGGDVALILMDLSLRGSEDGLRLTEGLRSDPRWKDIPIIATTAHAFSDDRVRALGAGCDAYLAKPIRREDLFEMMEGLLVEVVGPRPGPFVH